MAIEHYGAQEREELAEKQRRELRVANMNDQQKIYRLWGAIENFLDGETQGNVLGLRQALEACRPKVVFEFSDRVVETIENLKAQGFWPRLPAEK